MTLTVPYASLAKITSHTSTCHRSIDPRMMQLCAWDQGAPDQATSPLRRALQLSMEAMNGTPYGPPNPLAGNKFLQTLSQRYRFWLDKTTPHVAGRWVGLVVLLLLYGLRVWWLKGARTPGLLQRSTAEEHAMLCVDQPLSVAKPSSAALCAHVEDQGRHACATAEQPSASADCWCSCGPCMCAASSCRCSSDAWCMMLAWQRGSF